MKREITKVLTYTVHLEPEPDGRFTVTVPALPGCVTFGNNYAHALEMAQEVIEGFLEALAKARQPIPKEKSSHRAVDVQLSVRYPASL